MGALTTAQKSTVNFEHSGIHLTAIEFEVNFTFFDAVSEVKFTVQKKWPLKFTV